MTLNKEHIAIMEHTLKNGSFCGSSKEMIELVENGYMFSLGRKSFVPDEYFQITRKGKYEVN